MSFSSWNGASSSSAFVDSALAGSHEEASLSCTSVSFEANIPATPKTATQAMSTIHLVMGEVSFSGDLAMHGNYSIRRWGQPASGFPRVGEVDSATLSNSSTPVLLQK